MPAQKLGIVILIDKETVNEANKLYHSATQNLAQTETGFLVTTFTPASPDLNPMFDEMDAQYGKESTFVSTFIMDNLLTFHDKTFSWSSSAMFQDVPIFSMVNSIAYKAAKFSEGKSEEKEFIYETILKNWHAAIPLFSTNELANLDKLSDISILHGHKVKLAGLAIAALDEDNRIKEVIHHVVDPSNRNVKYKLQDLEEMIERKVKPHNISIDSGIFTNALLSYCGVGSFAPYSEIFAIANQPNFFYLDILFLHNQLAPEKFCNLLNQKFGNIAEYRRDDYQGNSVYRLKLNLTAMIEKVGPIICEKLDDILADSDSLKAYQFRSNNDYAYQETIDRDLIEIFSTENTALNHLLGKAILSLFSENVNSNRAILTEHGCKYGALNDILYYTLTFNMLLNDAQNLASNINKQFPHANASVTEVKPNMFNRDIKNMQIIRIDRLVFVNEILPYIKELKQKESLINQGVRQKF